MKPNLSKPTLFKITSSLLIILLTVFPLFCEIFADEMPIVPIPPTLTDEKSCVDKCGNGICEEIVCKAVGCPCSETVGSCPQDCQMEQ